MTNFNYYELLAFFYSGIFKQVKQGIDLDQAIIIIDDAFWMFPEEQYYLNNLIVCIHYMNVAYALEKNFTPKQVEVYKTQLKLVKENVNISEWLTSDEMEHFTETIDQLNYEIKNWELENHIK